MEHSGLSRRGLLASAGALGGALALGQLVRAQEPAQPAAEKPAEPKKPLFELSLAEWSLHKALQEKRLDHLDFPVVARKDYDIGSVEFVNTFFKDKAQDIAYLHELRKRADDNGVRCGLIMVDDEGPLAHSDDDLRNEAVKRHRMWLNTAAFLGCHSLRVNLDGKGSSRTQRDAAVESLSALGNYADPLDIRVLVENHGGYSTNPAWLAEVMRLTANKRVGTLPDFGNFKNEDGEEFDRYKGVAELMPWACAVSAKSYAFDEKGDETTIDFQRMLKIVVDAGYHSWVGIEYEGEKLSEPDGIRATKKLLLKVRDVLAATSTK
ncbi:MAG: TIM barrel protein [Planctomycetes bacterium]|nr:TIM barrel protein [Planctomycetota bacterium]